MAAKTSKVPIRRVLRVPSDLTDRATTGAMMPDVEIESPPMSAYSRREAFSNVESDK